MFKVKKIFKNLSLKAMAGFIVGIVLAVSITVVLAFIEPLTGPSGFDEPTNTLDMGNWTAYGRNETATTTLTKTTCEAANDWHWFEDGNGDGDYTDEEDGICVLATTTDALSWNGDDDLSGPDNTYIAAYTCIGSFPNGTVDTYSGTSSAGVADNIWNNGDCALCQADCYDGKKDLPGQNGYTIGDNSATGAHGPITPEVLKNWKGTRLPTTNDFFGFCGYKDGIETPNNYKIGCSSDTTHGYSGQMVGRTDECLDLSNTSYEWLLEQQSSASVRIVGASACSCFSASSVWSNNNRFRAVFRP